MPRFSLLPFRRLLRGHPSRAVLVALALATGAPPARAQQAPPPVAPDTAAPLALAARGVSPGGAFLRAVLLPGWGHASIGSYHRGAFYFVVEGATAWTLFKTRRRFTEAQERLLFHETLLRADLVAQGVTEEAEILEALEDDASLQDLRDLEESRRQQREDWTALGIFLLFLSGADAFVSAHLKDFPAPLELGVQPVGNGRVELSVGVSLPR